MFMNKKKSKYGWKDFLSLIYMVVPFLTTMWIQDEVNKPFIISFKYLSLPVIVLTYIYFNKFTEDWDSKDWLVQKTKPFVVALPIIYLSFGWVNIFNAFIPPQQKFIVSGHVVKKVNSRTTRTVTIINKKGDRIRVRVTRDEFRNTSVGEDFVKEMKKGSLGLLFKVGIHF